MRIAILAATPLLHDARVIRTGQTLSDAGHRVTVIAREPFPASLPFEAERLPPVPAPAAQRLELVLTQAPATLVPSLARALYWAPSYRRHMLAKALEAAPDVILCNDWLTLPVGAAVKRRTHALLVYDSHEYAVMEHVQNWKWRLVSRRAVATIEKRFIWEADLVMTVSPGIAKALWVRYRLPSAPTVIRNLPLYQAPSPRARWATRRVLFHGLIRPERGLEELIGSMPLWDFQGEVILRGYGAGPYIEDLKALASRLGVADRLRCEPPVPPADLVRRASEADIGYLVLPGTTDHYEFALPNKTFEYLMAGLPVLATPRAEIRALLTGVGAGLFTELDSPSIAAALNSLRDEDLTRMSAAALHAASTLNWEAEREKLLAAVAALRPGSMFREGVRHP